MAGLDDTDLPGGQPLTLARDGNALEVADDRGTEAFLEQPPHQAGAKLSFAASGPRLKYVGYVSLKTRLISSAGTSS